MVCGGGDASNGALAIEPEGLMWPSTARGSGVAGAVVLTAAAFANSPGVTQTELEECHMKVHRLQREIESISSESEKRLQELEAVVDVTTCERDRTMHANEKLKNEVNPSDPAAISCFPSFPVSGFRPRRPS